MLESLKIINEPLRSFATVLVECCAYAGTGNVLKIQHMLHICSEHFDQKDEKKVNSQISSMDRIKSMNTCYESYSRMETRNRPKIKTKIRRKTTKQHHKMRHIKVN
jgi:type IV secretory pathway VirD2 relaxase